jgi:hypothetical protein
VEERAGLAELSVSALMSVRIKAFGTRSANKQSLLWKEKDWKILGQGKDGCMGVAFSRDRVIKESSCS